MRPRVRTMRYQNPYFSKRTTHRRWPKRILLSVLLATVGFIGYLVLTPALAIQSVIIEGGRPETTKKVWEATQAYLSERAWFQSRRTSLLLVSEQKLTELLAPAAFTETVTAQRAWFPPGITVKITDRIPALLIDTSEATYLADSRGFIFGTLPDELAQASARTALSPRQATGTPAATAMIPPSFVRASGTTKLPVMFLTGNASSSSGRFLDHTSPVAPEFQEFISSILSLVSDSAGFPIISLAPIGDTDAFMDVRLEQGWTLRLSASRPLDEQLADANLVLTGLKIDRSRLDYLDVRYKDRVFYKER